MKVLVTGATGFVGYHLTQKLVKQGYKVKALVLQQSDSLLLKNLDVEIVTGDIRDIAVVEQAIKGCQHVYHLAARELQPGTSKQEYYTINVEGTKNVAHAAIKTDVERLVYASAVGVYGIIKNPPVNENTKLNPSSAYRDSKFLGEQVLFSYHKQEKLPVVVARLTGIIGAGSYSWLGLIKAISKNNFRMIGTGKNYDHVAHISDIVSGLQLCAEKGTEGELYILGGCSAITVKDLINMIYQELGISNSCRSLPVTPYKVFSYLGETLYTNLGFDLPGVHRYALFVANKILDISKAQKQLGYSPNNSIQEAIKETIDWYRLHGYI